MRILVTGGVRSGKSHHAESLLSQLSSVTYVAPGATAAQDPDADWAHRIAQHQGRRPAHWTTLESRDLLDAVSRPEAVLFDCLGTWLTGTIDDRRLWDASAQQLTEVIGGLVDEAAQALAARTDPIVLVTNEVGFGVVPEHRSGRLFRDLLGLVNQRIARSCDEVHLVVAGRVLIL